MTSALSLMSMLVNEKRQIGFLLVEMITFAPGLQFAAASPSFGAILHTELSLR